MPPMAARAADSDCAVGAHHEGDVKADGRPQREGAVEQNARRTGNSRVDGAEPATASADDTR